MLFIVKVFILVAMIKIVLQTEKPGVCAAVYTAIGLFFGLLLGRTFPALVVAGAIGFALAYFYFWLLTRTQESAVFWVSAVMGAVIGLV